MDDLHAKRMENDLEHVKSVQNKLEGAIGGLGADGDFPPAIRAELARLGYNAEVERKTGAQTVMLLSFSLARMMALTGKFEDVLAVLGDAASSDAESDAPENLCGEHRFDFVQAARFLHFGYHEMRRAMLTQETVPPVAEVRRNAYDVCAFILEIYRRVIAS